MGFEALIAGFASTASDIIADRREKAEEYEDQMREMAERNKGRYDAMLKAAEANEMLVARARNLLASDEQISLALDSGPDALRGMVQQLSQAKMDPDIGPMYNRELVQEMFQVNEDYTSTNIDVRARFGLEGMEVGDVAAPADDGFFARAFGRDSMARARANLDQELAAGTDVSVFDMAALSDANLYQSLTPGSFVNYMAPNVLTDAKFAEIEDAYLKSHNNSVRTALEVREGEYTVTANRLATMIITPEEAAAENAASDAKFNRSIQDGARGFFGFYGEGMLGFNDKFVPYLNALGGMHKELVAPILTEGLNPAVDASTLDQDEESQPEDLTAEPSVMLEDVPGSAAVAPEAPRDVVDRSPGLYTQEVMVTDGNGNTSPYELIPETGALIDTATNQVVPDVVVRDYIDRGAVIRYNDGSLYTGGGNEMTINNEIDLLEEQLDNLASQIANLTMLQDSGLGFPAERQAREQTIAELTAQLEAMQDRQSDLEDRLLQQVADVGMEFGMISDEDLAAMGDN